MSIDRTELTGLPGIAEAALTQALVATLPENKAPGAWTCRCSAVLWLGRGGPAATAVLPAGLGGATALITIGGFVRYTDTPVGGYNEVFGIVGARSGLRPWGNVAFMAVDSPDSLVGGRTNWAMPKTLAHCAGDPGAGSTMTATGADGITWSISAAARSLGPAVPCKTTGTVRQQFSDGRIGGSSLRFAGRIRPAVVTVDVSSEGGLAGWLRPGRHFGAIAESGTFSLEEPRFALA